jgi:nitroreductase/NAD-dependent dihydropyrimidine dehydrogenase PreA subunit
MAILTVDRQKCKRDGICVETCPMGIIQLKSKEDLPTLIPGGEALCIQCGHCVAVCPHGAMDHGAIPLDQCPPIQKELLLSEAQAEQFLRMRRSIRRYKKKSVPRELLARLIEVARHAPTGHNSQPVEWLVVYDTQEVRRLAGLVIDWMRHLVAEKSPLAAMLHMDLVIKSWEGGTERIFRDAPHVIVAHAPQAHRAAQSSCTIAMTYLELMTTALGLGGCWAGYFTGASQIFQPLIDALALPAGNMVFGAMMVGYPKYRYYRMPLRKTPKIIWR